MISSHQSIKTPCIPIDSYDRPQSYRYFKKIVVVETVFEGPAYIVGMTIYNTVNEYKSFDDDNIILNLLMAKFVAGLTRNQRMEFALIIDMIKYRKRDIESSYKTATNEPVGR